MKILVILASTRPGRVGERVASWVLNEARNQLQFDIELVDLATYDLPFFAEEAPPRYNPNRHPVPEAKRWLAKLDEGDGYIIVTPEYNGAMPAVLKNALDYVDHQLTKKPVAIVSYGIVGGAKSAEQLKLLAIASRAAVVPQAVGLQEPSNALDESGRYLGDTSGFGPNRSLTSMLTELDWWTTTLKNGRSQTAKLGAV